MAKQNQVAQLFRVLNTLVFLMLFAATATASAQVIRSSIGGTILDDTGAALPGVTVTATSPALQTPQLVVVSDGEGRYRFSELPGGTYRLTFELPGFTTLVRESIQLSTAFGARVDVTLMLGGLAETVTVSGGSPLVDVSQTRGSTRVSTELLNTIPNTGSMVDALAISGGMILDRAPMRGDGGVEEILSLARASTYGDTGRRGGGGAAPTYQTLDGVLTYPHQIPGLDSIEEVDVRTYGNTAEVGHPGGATVLVVKSGGNEFRGRMNLSYQGAGWNSNNLDDYLRRQGTTVGRSVNYYVGVSGELGGHIVRDKLWFFGAYQDRISSNEVPGFVLDRGSDGLWGTADDTPAEKKLRTPTPTFKLSLQATPSHRFVGLYTNNTTVDNSFTGNAFIPLEATYDYRQPFPTAKGEWQANFGERLYITNLVGYHALSAFRKPQDCCASEPSRFDLLSQRQWGSAWGDLRSEDRSGRTATRYQASGSLSYFPSSSFLGSHKVTAGYILLPERLNVDLPVAASGDYRLVYRNGLPQEMWTRNTPLSGDSWQRTYALYASDEWQMSNRVSVNVGLRWNRLSASIPAKVKAEGPWPSDRIGQFPAVDIGSWQVLQPRVGAAVDLFGDGKTVAKGTYGLYSQDFGYAWAATFDPNYVTTTRYRWQDPDRNDDYTPGEVDLGVNGRDILGITGATGVNINPDLKWTRAHEVSASIEHDLGGSLSVRALYVLKQNLHDHAQVNPLRPFSAWTQEITRQDPGPDGVLGTADDGTMVTFYDYDPAFRGAAFVANTLVNSTRDSRWQNIELRLEKRQTNNWFAVTSLLMTKSHAWLNTVVQTPNHDIFPLNDTWNWAYRLTSGYTMWGGVALSGTAQVDSGVQGQRVVVFSAPSSGSLTIPVEPFGAQKGPIKALANLRASKGFSAGDQRFNVYVDMFNLFNSNVAFLQSFVSGNAFGRVTDFPAPRSARVGFSYDF